MRKLEELSVIRIYSQRISFLSIQSFRAANNLISYQQINFLAWLSNIAKTFVLFNQRGARESLAPLCFNQRSMCWDNITLLHHALVTRNNDSYSFFGNYRKILNDAKKTGTYFYHPICNNHQHSHPNPMYTVLNSIHQ